MTTTNISAHAEPGDGEHSVVADAERVGPNIAGDGVVEVSKPDACALRVGENADKFVVLGDVVERKFGEFLGKNGGSELMDCVGVDTRGGA